MKLLMENWRKFLAEEEKDFEAHMMFDPKTGDKKQAKTEAEHNELAKKGYVHTDPAKIRKALEDEGGAAGTDAIVDRTDASGEEVKKAMDAMPDVAQHKKGDYILGDKDKIKIEEDCWDGYERVPGSKEGAPGSCRKKTNEGEEDEASVAPAVAAEIKKIIQTLRNTQEAMKAVTVKVSQNTSDFNHILPQSEKDILKYSDCLEPAAQRI